MAAVLSLFVPGLGHLMLGKPFSGLFWFVVVLVLYVVAGITVGVGLIVAIPAHLLCMYRANSIANQQHVKLMSKVINRR